MDERILRRMEQLVEAATGRFPAKLGEEWSGVGPVKPPPPPRSRVEQIEPERAEERYTPRSRLERIEAEGERKEAPREAPSPPIPTRPAGRSSGIGLLLSSRETLRQAILMQEILGPPKALRERDGIDGFRS